MPMAVAVPVPVPVWANYDAAPPCAGAHDASRADQRSDDERSDEKKNAMSSHEDPPR